MGNLESAENENTPKGCLSCIQIWKSKRAQLTFIYDANFILPRELSQGILRDRIYQFFIKYLTSGKLVTVCLITNDPIAGSPTITLLRLFLPPIPSIHNEFSRNCPRHSQWEPVGRNDGRCVQTAGTYSEQYSLLHLQGIPSSSLKIAKDYPNQDTVSVIHPVFQQSDTLRCPL